jgi:hypothetical protein
MTDILAKPFSKASLFDILQRYCSHLLLAASNPSNNDYLALLNSPFLFSPPGIALLSNNDLSSFSPSASITEMQNEQDFNESGNQTNSNTHPQGHALDAAVSCLLVQKLCQRYAYHLLFILQEKSL